MRVDSQGRSRDRLRTLVAAVAAFVWIFLAACSARPDPAVETIVVAPQLWVTNEIIYGQSRAFDNP